MTTISLIRPMEFTADVYGAQERVDVEVDMRPPSEDMLARYRTFLALPLYQRQVIEARTGFPAFPGRVRVVVNGNHVWRREAINALARAYDALVVRKHAWSLRQDGIDVTKRGSR